VGVRWDSSCRDRLSPTGHLPPPTTKIAAATVLTLCAACLPPVSACAVPTVTFRAALLPERLGAGTPIKFAFSIEFPRKEEPVPLRAIDLDYPANGIATSGLGLSTCRAKTLETQGPPGCPSTSVMGYGSGLVEVPFGPSTVYEQVRLTTFMAPLSHGHLGLLFFADGETPVSAELVFHGLVLPATSPYGGDLATTVPLVPTLPEAPDAILAQFDTTLGPSGITYYEYSQGRYIPYHPRGILLPRQCPPADSRSPPRSPSTTALGPAPTPSCLAPAHTIHTNRSHSA
jgi:hypothetical protein